MIVTVSELKNMYNIYLSDSLVEKALNLAHEYVRGKISRVYEKEIMSASVGKKHSFYIPTGYWVMDSDFNNQLSPTDLVVKEFNPETYEEQEISSSLITSIRQYKYGNANRLIVEFSEDVPHTNYNSLYFRFNITPVNLKDNKYKYFVKEFITLYAFKNLLSYVDLNKLQTGIASYNLNGVNLTVDSSTIRNVLEDIDKRLALLYNEFMPLIYTTWSASRDEKSIYFRSSSKTVLR